MNGETLPPKELKEVSETYWQIVRENFGSTHNDTKVDFEVGGDTEASYGPYVAEPLILEGVGIFFPYDWEPEKLSLYQELFSGFSQAPSLGYPSFEEFLAAIQPELNGEIGAFNFLSALAAGKDTVMDLALEHKPAYQRAKLLAPDLNMDIDTLRDKLRKYSTDIAVVPEDLLREAYELLNLTGKLVDQKDENLFRHIDIRLEGDAYEIDRQYLLH